MELDRLFSRGPDVMVCLSKKRLRHPLESGDCAPDDESIHRRRGAADCGADLETENADDVKPFWVELTVHFCPFAVCQNLCFGVG